MNKHFCASCGNHVIESIKICPKCRGRNFVATQPVISATSTAKPPASTPASPAQSSVQSTAPRATSQTSRAATRPAQSSSARPTIGYKYCQDCANHVLETMLACPKCRGRSFGPNAPTTIKPIPTKVNPPQARPVPQYQAPPTPQYQAPPTPQYQAPPTQPSSFGSALNTASNVASGVTSVVVSLFWIVVVVGMFVSNPTPQDFDRFIAAESTKMINKEFGDVGFLSYLGSQIAVGLAKEATKRNNYYLFSIYEVDTSLLNALSSDVPARFRLLGIAGTFIPLDQAKQSGVERKKLD